MKAFARLFAALDETNRTTEKVAAMVEYFASVPPADAAWTVYFLSGGRPKRLIPVRRLSAWAMEEAKVPEWLFDECYDAVGDLAETIAHLLPVTDATSSLPLNRWVTERLLPLATQREEEQREVVLASWRELHGTARFVWNKLMTGCVPGRRVAATGGARAGEVQRRGRGDAGPPAERPVDAVGGVVHGAGDGGHERCRPVAAVPVLPGVPARGRDRGAGGSVASGNWSGSGTGSGRS